jgi:hypothetical protein
MEKGLDQRVGNIHRCSQNVKETFNRLQHGLCWLVEEIMKAYYTLLFELPIATNDYEGYYTWPYI